MPTFFVVMEVHTQTDARAGFKTNRVRQQQVRTAAAEGLCRGEQRRHHRRRGMAAHGVAAVVVVERMRGGAVDECRIKRRGVLDCARDGAGATARGQRISQQGDAVFAGAGEHAAQRIHHRDT